MKVIGSVGDDQKLEFIKELGFTDGFNYKKEHPRDGLKRLAPDGIDIFYDNVGGEQLDIALEHINVHGRIGKPNSHKRRLLLIVCSGMRSDFAVQPKAW